jgi:hypothetical protein
MLWQLEDLMLLRRFAVVLAAVAAGLLGPSGESLAKETSRTIFGFVERVIISEEGFSVKAKLDTGAETSSLDARNIKRFKRDGTSMVRFEVLDPDSEEFVTLERPLSRTVRIRQHIGPEDRRPVVKMLLCVGHIAETVDVNLIDRGHFVYPLLIGRSAMRGRIIVDPALTFTSRPLCTKEELAE